VGEENKGWTIAKALLQHERNFISSFGLGGSADVPGNSGMGGIVKIAKNYIGEKEGKISNGYFRGKVAAQR
jgi:hypothetical protein